MKYHAVKLLVKVQNPFSYSHLLFCSDRRRLNNSFVHFVIAAILPASEDINTECLVASEFSTADYSSPILETPLFRTIAATIPSPKFSESVSNLAFNVFFFYIQPERNNQSNYSQFLRLLSVLVNTIMEGFILILSFKALSV